MKLDEKFISTIQAADMAKVEDRTVRFWCEKKHFAAFKISDKWVIELKSFEKFLAKKDN